MRRAGAALAVVLGMTSAASAEDHSLYDRLWPQVPDGHQLTLSQQITDQLTELGNQLGHHLDLLSNDILRLQFDGRKRRAYVRLGAGDVQYLTFRLASDVLFTDGRAVITTQLDLGIAGRTLHLELPDFEMVPAEYRGDRGVEVRLPLFKRNF